MTKSYWFVAIVAIFAGLFFIINKSSLGIINTPIFLIPFAVFIVVFVIVIWVLSIAIKEMTFPELVKLLNLKKGEIYKGSMWELWAFKNDYTGIYRNRQLLLRVRWGINSEVYNHENITIFIDGKKIYSSFFATKFSRVKKIIDKYIGNQI